MIEEVVNASKKLLDGVEILSVELNKIKNL